MVVELSPIWVALALVFLGFVISGISLFVLWRAMNYTPPKHRRRKTYIKP